MAVVAKLLIVSHHMQANRHQETNETRFLE